MLGDKNHVQMRITGLEGGQRHFKNPDGHGYSNRKIYRIKWRQNQVSGIALSRERIQSVITGPSDSAHLLFPMQNYQG